MNYPMDNLCKANYFHFITTNSLGEQKYLTTINFKEIYLSDTGDYVVYKAQGENREMGQAFGKKFDKAAKAAIENLTSD